MLELSIVLKMHCTSFHQIQDLFLSCPLLQDKQKDYRRSDMLEGGSGQLIGEHYYNRHIIITLKVDK